MMLTMIHLTGRQDKRAQLRALLIEVETMRPGRVRERELSTTTQCLLCPPFFFDNISSPLNIHRSHKKVLLTETQNANTPIVPPSVSFTRAHL